MQARAACTVLVNPDPLAMAPSNKRMQGVGPGAGHISSSVCWAGMPHYTAKCTQCAAAPQAPSWPKHQLHQSSMSHLRDPSSPSRALLPTAASLPHPPSRCSLQASCMHRTCAGTTHAAGWPVALSSPTHEAWCASKRSISGDSAA